MNAKLSIIYLFIAITALISTGCLVHEKVTVNGQVKEEGYAVKRPLKEALANSP